MELRIRCLSAGYCIMIWAVTFARVRPFASPVARHRQRLPFLQTAKPIPHGGLIRIFSTFEGTPEPMENLYQAWTVEQDQFLFDNRKESLPKLAAMTGRGLRGVEARLAKLKDINSAAYMRLWAGQECVEMSDKETKLVPANEVLRRIQWDHSLTESDFSVLHYDRMEDKVMESPMDAPNKSVAGKSTLFVLAIPEHRIVGIKYKEQIVWDKEQRMDRVFGSMNGRGETIAQVMINYDEWKERKRAADELDRQRQMEVSNRVQQILGDQRYVMLKELSLSLRNDQDLLTKKELETYVNTALQLFRDARGDPGQDPSIVPSTDGAALDVFSELVAMLPDPNLRSAILTEISSVLNGLEVKSKGSKRQDLLPEIDEEDLTETFVRGSGAGGQKVNKTSNKVVLVHVPTQLRVECQDTRSLSQNRKIARKRLRAKLDEFINGSQSKGAIKATEVALKKAKSKTRNKSRQRKKMGAAGDSDDEDSDEDDAYEVLKVPEI